MPARTCYAFTLMIFLLATGLFTVTSSGQSCVEPPNTTMVAWFPFDELAGTASTNVATGGSGTQINGPLGIAGGKVGGAASFDGASQYITSPAYLGINFGPARPFPSCSGDDSSCSGDFTIDAWVLPVNTGNDMVIVDKMYDDNGYYGPTGYTFFINGTHLGVELADGTLTRYQSPDSIPLYDGNWHHVAVTIARGSASVITFYNNGAALPTTMVPNNPGSLIGSGFFFPLSVGVRLQARTGWYRGNIDELEIFNRVLGPSEVKAINDADSAGKCRPGSTALLASCVPAGSHSVLIQKPDVIAYVPRAYWTSKNPDIRVVPIEGPSVGSPASITTPNPVNSCASNSNTGETVCVANGTNTSNNDIYLITGTTINKTLQSSATYYVCFSGTGGGYGTKCPSGYTGVFNAGVAINPVRNEAVIEVGTVFNPGLEVLNLTPNSGSYTSFTRLLTEGLSENIQVDPYRDLILSPSELNYYSLVKRSTQKLVDYWYQPKNLPSGGEMDSAAEDCTTGIALSTLEFSTSLYMVDLTQASYATVGTNRTWSAPDVVKSFPEFGNMNAGTDGIAVAPGTHLAIVTGEYGGNEIGVVTLPSSSGGGTPTFGKYKAAYLLEPGLKPGFSLGYDPHTVTAYVSPNDGRAYGVVANWITGVPSELAIIDLDALLNKAPLCHGSGLSKCILGPYEVDPQYDLVANKIVRFVSPPNF